MVVNFLLIFETFDKKIKLDIITTRSIRLLNY